ncbi:hypothetical protein BJ508DRAFT_306277 [Ascobolus immersus RN42]|uniref:Uncharacterized protein n=1 Tax=Ascobolus immersus RN42 TaxID=1160509 RepID=A0A3N4IBR9_ASCIM|nr:hypothetical protein BJ508DRAFT_306277 [Ascobolus immersus RN42]
MPGWFPKSHYYRHGRRRGGGPNFTRPQLYRLRRNFTKFLARLASRFFGFGSSNNQWGSIYSPVVGSLPAMLGNLEVPTTYNQVIALSDLQLGRIIRAAGACSHSPANGHAFHRFELLALVFVLVGCFPPLTLWENAPPNPQATVANVSTEGAVRDGFNDLA